MQIFDASSIIYAWDNYPVNLFPKLWDWIATQSQLSFIKIPQIAYIEIGHNSPECSAWLNESGLSRIPVTNDILMNALRAKTALGILENRYGAGVDENDLIIIATAKSLNAILISDERIQPDLPKNKINFKIPAVCSMAEVKVECINFLEYIKRSGATF